MTAKDDRPRTPEEDRELGEQQKKLFPPLLTSIVSVITAWLLIDESIDIAAGAPADRAPTRALAQLFGELITWLAGTLHVPGSIAVGALLVAASFGWFRYAWRRYQAATAHIPRGIPSATAR